MSREGARHEHEQSREGDKRVESKSDALLKERGNDPDEFDYEERRELA